MQDLPFCLHLTVVRKQEEELEKGQKVVVIEDLISTAGSCIEVVNVLREAGAEVLGIASIFTGGEDGILYPGFIIKNNDCDYNNEALEKISKSLADACIQMWSDPVKEQDYCKNARKHAEKNHNPEQNYKKMVEIYAKICNGV